jgi:hypothetical protein
MSNTKYLVPRSLKVYSVMINLLNLDDEHIDTVTVYVFADTPSAARDVALEHFDSDETVENYLLEDVEEVANPSVIKFVSNETGTTVIDPEKPDTKSEAVGWLVDILRFNPTRLENLVVLAADRNEAIDKVTQIYPAGRGSGDYDIVSVNRVNTIY